MNEESMPLSEEALETAVINGTGYVHSDGIALFSTPHVSSDSWNIEPGGLVHFNGDGDLVAVAIDEYVEQVDEKTNEIKIKPITI